MVVGHIEALQAAQCGTQGLPPVEANILGGQDGNDRGNLIRVFGELRCRDDIDLEQILQRHVDGVQRLHRRGGQQPGGEQGCQAASRRKMRLAHVRSFSCCLVKSMKSCAGIGRANRKPWKISQPMSRNRAACASVSTPSATTLRPRAWPRVMMACTSAVSRLSPSRSMTKERSILISSMLKRLR